MIGRMFLGIEIGGTKLQLGVGDGSGGQLAALVRRDVDRQRGASGILHDIEHCGKELLHEHPIQRIGVGFGGPVNSATGVATKSHQVAGWDNFPLAAWCQEKLGRPTVIGNDCDAAALAEAKYGAGRGADGVFYVTVGTGIGGGLVLGGKLHGAGRPAVAEIGHLRPSFDVKYSQVGLPETTVESYASGPAIAEGAWAFMGTVLYPGTDVDIADLRARCGNDRNKLTAQIVAAAAADGNRLAKTLLEKAIRVLGWALAQTITLMAPEVIVIGGGVSLMGEKLFFEPLRQMVAEYVFHPLLGSYRIMAAELGEFVVIHGAIALAAGEE